VSYLTFDDEKNIFVVPLALINLELFALKGVKDL